MPPASEPLNDYVGLLANNILFADADPDLLPLIAAGLEYQAFAKNDLIYRQGEKSLGLYLVLGGSVQIYSEHRDQRVELSHSRDGHLFGEFLLSGDSVRSANAQALADTEVLFWPVHRFSELVKQYPQAFLPITTRLVKRLGWNQTMQALRVCDLFIGLDERIVRQLINQLNIQSIPANTLLYQRNDTADNMCIVVNGQFQVSITGDDQQSQVIRLIGRGDTLGEMGLISGASHLTDVRAIRDSTVAYLSRETYQNLLQQFPLEINQTFVKSIINHLDQDNRVRPISAETLALINLSSADDLTEFLNALTRALKAQGTTTLLSSAIVDQAFMHRDAAQCDFLSPDNADLVQWLSEQESIHQYIVYCADGQLNHWTRRCLRQADQVLFLVEDQDDPQIQRFEAEVLAELADKAVKKILIVQHAADTVTPRGTALWLTDRQPDWHYHVRKDRQADFDRLARFLTGNALGLVLGGGAARGFAHIGVLRALRELNIAVDLVGGNSMGAVLAAEFALQWDEQTMLEKTRQLCLQGDRPTLPIVSLFSGNTMTAALRNLFGDLQIEDLWIPFFCVSCNISRAKLMTHRHGTLLAALLSSNAPPGLFPPQISHGDLLVDGALLNNLPVDVMREFNRGGSVIAVDVNKREDLLNNTDHLGGISGWQLVWSRLNPTAAKVSMPSMVQILMRASMIGGLAQQKKMREGLADLYLQPPTHLFGLTDYTAAEKIAEAGYAYAIEKLTDWQANRLQSKL